MSASVASKLFQSLRSSFTNRQCTLAYVLTATLFALVSVPAHAGRYELVTGKGVEVCEAYLKNLNAFDRTEPLVCEREIHPSAKDFKIVEWKKLDAWENRELVKNIELFLNNHPRGKPNGNIQKWEEGVRDRAESVHLGISITQIDIDNDGKPENVVKYYDGSCAGSTRKYAIPILVVNSNLRTLDVERTMWLMQNPTVVVKNPNPQYGDIISGPPTGGWEGVMYDIFLYRNRPYFDRWGTYRYDSATLKVYQTNKDKTAEICTYRFGVTE